MKKPLTILASLLITACTANQHSVSEEQAYVALLTKEVESAESIMFVEHSYKFDFLNSSSNKTIDIEKTPTYIYKTQIITARQQKNLVSSLESMEEKDMNMFSSCIFVPHHRIEFYKSGKLSSSMEICFHCADIEWDMTNNARPIDLIAVLGSAFTEAGFKTSKDWSALAKSWPSNAEK